MSAAPEKNVETVLQQLQITSDEAETSPFGDNVLRLACCVLDFLTVSGIENGLKRELGLKREWHTTSGTNFKAACTIATAIAQLVEERFAACLHEATTYRLDLATMRGGIDPWPWKRSEPSRAEG
ncbi:hypothetical protein [Streptomyces sp. NPDC003710]